jgi:glycosyltransferase involved in cell wall biosynthesis
MEQGINKKLILATGIFPPDIGGPATYVKTLSEELPKRGFAVKVVTYGKDDKNSKFQAQNSNQFQNSNSKIEDSIYYISRNQNVLSRYMKYFIQVWKLLAWADLVFVQDPMSAGLPTWLSCKLRGKKYFLKIVGDYAWEQGRQKNGVVESLDDFQNKKYGFKVELWRKIQKMVARDAEKIITPSFYLKKILEQWGVNTDKVKVIYNSVKKIEPPKKSKDEIKKELGISGDMIISPGRLVPWKGFGTLIKIMPEILKVNPDFKLIIIGGGPEMDNLKLEIGDLGLEEKVILTGALEQDLFWKYCSAAEMFVLNTGYEGLPHITIEAMQLGLPVITTKAGGNMEVAVDRENSLLVDYDDREQLASSILEIWKNKELASRLAANARVSVSEKFGKERMVREVAETILNFKF